jgi:hypothetical protein
VRRVVAFAGLLLVCLVASYVTWTTPKVEEKAGSADKIPMFAVVAKDEVDRITWKSDELTVDIERKKDELGAYTWITSTETVEKKVPPPPKASDTDEPPPAPPPEKVTTVSKFRGNDQAEKLWEAFTPLKALRQLDGDNAVFGFDAPKATLTLDRAGRPAEMKLGGETYGAKDRFVQFDGKAWLVDDADLRPLQFAKTRLMERGLQPLAEKDIASISIKSPAGEASFDHKNRQDQPNAKWANVKAPDHEDSVGAGWIDKLLKTKVQSYPGADAAPPANLKPMFSVVVAGDTDKWPITFLVGQSADGKSEYWAQSAYDRSMVKLVPGSASEVIADVDGAVTSNGGSAPEPEEEEKSP